MTRTLATLLTVALLVVGSAGVGLAVTAPAAPDASSTTLAQDNATDGNETDGNVTVENETMDNETEPMAGNETTTNATANVTFLNQTTNGSAVLVNETTLPEGGFVVIHLANQTSPGNFSAGPVIGNSSYLEAGDHEDLVVTINETLEEAQWLIAMPHMDTNDNQVYEFPEADAPYTVDTVPVTDEAYVEISDEDEINVTEEPVTVDVVMGEDATENETMAGNETMDDGEMVENETMGNESATNESAEA